MIDLHIHTDNSDGEFNVVDILKIAQEKELKYISLTDHDNINVYNQLNDIEISNFYKGEIISGVELQCKYKDIIIEVLGYKIDIDKMKKTKIIREGLVHSTIEGETERLNYIKTVCNKLNIKYDENIKINKPNDMANDVLLDNIITYSENNNTLIELGITNRTTFYRNHYINYKSPFFIDMTTGKPDFIDAVQTIKNCGGICFLAHPVEYICEDYKKLLDEIISLNKLDGIECVQKKHSKEQIEYLLEYCERNKLLKSGGSDFHRLADCMGHGNQGTYPINDSLVLEWL